MPCVEPAAYLLRAVLRPSCSTLQRLPAHYCLRVDADPNCAEYFATYHAPGSQHACLQHLHNAVAGLRAGSVVVATPHYPFRELGGGNGGRGGPSFTLPTGTSGGRIYAWPRLRFWLTSAHSAPRLLYSDPSEVWQAGMVHRCAYQADSYLACLLPWRAHPRQTRHWVSV